MPRIVERPGRASSTLDRPVRGTGFPGADCPAESSRILAVWGLSLRSAGATLMEVRKVADRASSPWRSLSLACLAVWPAFDGPVRLDAGRALLPGARARDPRHGPRRRDETDVRRADLREAARERSAEDRQPRLGRSTTSRSTSGASPCRSPPRRSTRSPATARCSTSRSRGYVAAILALFGLLLLRFRLAIAAAVTAATVFLPPLVDHSSYPLTDSWGLALEIVAFARRPAGARARADAGCCSGSVRSRVLSFTRDSTWIPVLAAGWCALRLRIAHAGDALRDRGRRSATRAPALHDACARPARAARQQLPGAERHVVGVHRAATTPHAVFELVRANVGFLRRGEWYTALYLVGGVVALLLLVAATAPDERLAVVADRRRRRRARLRARGAGLQRLPARARLRADGRVRAGARDRACRRSRRRARRRARRVALRIPVRPGVRCEALLMRIGAASRLASVWNLDAWLGRSGPSALVPNARAG